MDLAQNIDPSSFIAHRLYGGVDGGGTKTLAIVVDEQGREIGRGVAGGSNCQTVGPEEASRRIAGALRQAAGGNLPLSGLCIGLAGVDRLEDRAGMLVELSKTQVVSQKQLWLGNDAELILLSLPGGNGLGLIAGTGSIALGRAPGSKLVRAGGWGHTIGDEGSGYDLGRRAIQASAQMADGRGPHTLLLEAILKEWNLSEPSQMIGIVYNPSTKVADFARLARLVSVTADAGDAVAQRLLKGAALDLARAVEAVATRLDFGETAPGLALAGGLLLGELSLRRLLLRRLRRTVGIGAVRRVREPARNAARAALSMFSSPAAS